MFNTVVRYNMRGAHSSVAKRNFNIFNVLTSPEPDPEDLVSVCDYVLQKLPDPPTELYLVGYSYGATVAASALQQVPQVMVQCCVAGRSCDLLAWLLCVSFTVPSAAARATT
jgi:pimeloyl-ACP methyl ester carboxylesterase